MLFNDTKIVFKATGLNDNPKASRRIGPRIKLRVLRVYEEEEAS